MSKLARHFFGLAAAAALLGCWAEARAQAVDLTLTISGASGNVAIDGTNCVRAVATTETTCTVSRNTGDSVTLTATAAAASAFAGWGGACSGTSTCTLTMDAPKTVTAGFGATVVPLLTCMSYRADINGVTARFGYLSTAAGTVSIPFGQDNFFTPSPPFRGQPTMFEPGLQRQVLEVTFPTASYVQWNLNRIQIKAQLSDASIPGCDPPAQTLPLSVMVAGSGTGTVTSDGVDCTRSAGQAFGACDMARGALTSTTLTASAAPGSSFAGWGGACSGTAPSCTLVMDGAKTVVAGFVAMPAVSDILVDPNVPGTLYAALDGAGIYKKTASSDWTTINTGLGNLGAKALAIAAVGGVLYAATDGGGVFASVDAGAHWAACASQPGDPHVHSLVLAGSTLYAGTTSGVFVSGDGCASWTAFNAGLPN